MSSEQSNWVYAGIFVLLVSVGLAIVLYNLLQPEEGDECNPKDYDKDVVVEKKGNYEIKEIKDKKQCVLESCITGWNVVGSECVMDYVTDDDTADDDTADDDDTAASSNVAPSASATAPSATAPSAAAPAPAPLTYTKLRSGGDLWKVDEKYKSPNGKYEIIQQGDGNLVIYAGNPPRATWDSVTAGMLGARVKFWAGHLFMWDVTTDKQLKSISQVAEYKDSHIWALGNDGSLTIRDKDAKVLKVVTPADDPFADDPSPAAADPFAAAASLRPDLYDSRGTCIGVTTRGGTVKKWSITGDRCD